MAGIYVHIPFCKQACYYCNFHFSTQLDNRQSMVDAICKDIHLRQNYLEERQLDSLYFGGGTPSLLSIGQLSQIIEAVNSHFTLLPGAEITMECNPDDINMDYLAGMRELGINRISLGVQSFFDEDLLFMHRAHDARHATRSLENIREAGFTNITLDLIYGSPTTTDEMWQKNLEMAIASEVSHISAYCLTIEENTVFGRWHKHQKMAAIDDEKASRQFYQMLDALESAGFEQYEISNFAKKGYRARHNGSYWKGAHYLGVGPAAHSFNGFERSWAVANNARYIRSIEEGWVPVETEVLTRADQCNEMIMTRLRTSDGLDLQQIEHNFGSGYVNEIKKGLEDEEVAGLIEVMGSIVRLNRSGKIMADRIAAHLFVTDPYP